MCVVPYNAFFYQYNMHSTHYNNNNRHLQEIMVNRKAEDVLSFFSVSAYEFSLDHTTSPQAAHYFLMHELQHAAAQRAAARCSLQDKHRSTFSIHAATFCKRLPAAPALVV